MGQGSHRSSGQESFGIWCMRCRMQEMHRTMWYESWGRMGRCTPHVSTMMLLCSLGRVLATPQWVLCCGRSLRKTCWRTSLQQLHQSVMCVSSGLAQRLISYFSAFPACLQTSQGMCSVAHLPAARVAHCEDLCGKCGA